MSFLDHEGSYLVDFPLKAAFDAALEKLKSSKEFPVQQADSILHKINVKAGMSLFSWGENITITFKEHSPSKTEISILSTPKFGGSVDIVGKNRQNIDRVMQAISEALQNLPPAQAPAPRIQTDFKFICPHCGQHLECPPELENVTCECPSCRNSITPVR